MLRILVGGILAITAIYLLVNLGYLAALGLTGMRESKAVAADLMRPVAGEAGAIVVAVVVCVSALTTMNAAIITGARSNYAFGRDYASLAPGRREPGTPATHC
jgi:amino acid transporter